MPDYTPAVALPLSYNLRNLLVRKVSSGLTFVVVAVVVFVLAVLLSFATGIQRSLAVSGSPRNILIIKPGATAESTSIILPEEANRVTQAPGLAVDSAGRPLMSREIYVQTLIPRRSADRRDANVAVRGVEPAAFELRENVSLVAGRRFDPAALEVLVGRKATERFADLEIGRTVTLGRQGNRAFTIVGVFAAEGGALESEIWGPRTLIADSYGRNFFSSVLLRLAPGAPAAPTLAYLNGPAVDLQARPENEYYRELSSKTAEIAALATMLVAIMAIGAAFAVANTMFAAVDGRRREIAMLRTIGFRRRAIVFSFVLEAVLLCGAACLAGLASGAGFNWLNQRFQLVTQDFLSNATWTVLAFDMQLSPGVVAAAGVTALLVAVIGALAPAVRAARTQIIEALRKA